MAACIVYYSDLDARLVAAGRSGVQFILDSGVGGGVDGSILTHRIIHRTTTDSFITSLGQMVCNYKYSVCSPSTVKRAYICQNVRTNGELQVSKDGLWLNFILTLNICRSKSAELELH